MKSMYRRIFEHPAVYMVEAPLVSYSIKATNCFIIVDGEEALVVDTGARFEKNYDRLSSSLEGLGIPEGNVSFFITHMHYDHMGVLDQLASPNAKVYMSKGEYERSFGDGLARYTERIDARFREEGVSLHDMARYRRLREINLNSFLNPHAYRFVSHGDSIEIGSIKFRVVRTSGHTQEHLSLFEELSGLFFCGDSIVYEFPPALDCFADGSDSIRAFFESLDLMESLDFSWAMQSHGALFGDARGRISAMREHRVDKGNRIVDVVRLLGNSSGSDILAEYAKSAPGVKYHEAPISPKYSLLKEGVAFLDHLVSVGRLIRFYDDSGTFLYDVRKTIGGI